jgi:nucleoside-diphosphate-sugar epimerase
MGARGTHRRPRLVVAGNPARVGRHVADAARQEYQVFVVTTRSPEACGAAPGEPGSWLQVDLGDAAAVAAAFRSIAAGGAVDVVLYVGADPLPGVAAAEAARPLAHVVEASRLATPQRLVLARPEPSDSAAAAGDDAAARAAVESAEDEILRAARGALPVTRIRFAPRPRLVLTGASGFLGRHLIQALQEDFQVVALARSSPSYCGVPPHPNLAWMQVDLADRAALAAAFRTIREGGGAEFVVHLAAYYDFTGDPHPEYERTNVVALRALLEECRDLRLRRFVFASSLAASDFPPRGVRLDESSAPDGPHPYAVTKRRGEALLREFPEVPSAIVRLAAIYSDWLEYPPLFVLFERWLSKSWDRGILGGRGVFAIPYLHVHDVASFVVRLLGAHEDLAPAEVLIASPDEPTSLRALFERVGRDDAGRLPPSPTLPAPVCRLGMVARDLFGRVTGSRPFERPWMAGYIDRRMPVDAHRTRARLGWAPRERLQLERRLPLVLQNRAANPTEWLRRNQTVMRRDRTAQHLEVHALLERNEAEILRRAAAHGAVASPDDWGGRVAFEQLRAAVRNRDAFGFGGFCALLAERRFDQGALPAEVDAELRALADACLVVVRGDAAPASLRARAEETLSLQFLLGRDQVEERFELLRVHPHRRVG